MPLPAGVIFISAARAAATVARRNGGILLLSALFIASPFVFSVFINEAASTAIRLWPLFLLAALFSLSAIALREYFFYRNKKYEKRGAP